ncbi:similar to Saccharomyces cerevisiae YER119C AVT6 Vacuolar aspartate and glutamate exporter [Geotrichum candidum]|uniref:Similar to Saccharomyces cerevisiae YER119C AVT6 Vacuolar aspartate and glutamate exporter n=1 Tax=Geotrichum candidum TaxID=1173061 RepID=A0A0J9XCU9_GEOCN|nr:similar to Saccharomyces cerevisiae YER119C AVT6 Vacuolar aspartate and glutamate exporter [Geotrichum candidum]
MSHSYHSLDAPPPADAESIPPIRGKSTDGAAIINLLNTIVGAGILAMPFAIKQNGIVLGVATISFSALAAGMGLYLQGLCSLFVRDGHASFFQLSQKTYPSLSVIFDLAIAIKCFGVGVSYLIILGDLMPQIANSFGITHSVAATRSFWILISFFIVGPLSFLKHLDSLKYTSVIALVAVGYLVVIVIYQFFFFDSSEHKGNVNIVQPQSLAAVLKALPVFIFAFTCHQNMFSSLNEIPVKKEANFRKIVTFSIGPAAIVYIMVGLAGYLTFGDKVGGNIIAMYPYSIKIVIGQIAIAILVLLSYPLQCHPCRASIRNIINWIKTRNSIENINEYAELEEEVEQGEVHSHDHDSEIIHDHHSHHLLITSVIVALSLITALKVHSLEVMLAFVGSTGSTSISFILPGLFTYKLLTLQRDQFINPSFHENFYGVKTLDSQFSIRDQILRAAAIFLFFWGLLVLVVCLGINIITFG